MNQSEVYINIGIEIYHLHKSHLLKPPPVLPDRDDQYTASRKWTNEHLKFEHCSEPKEAQQMCVQSLQL